MYLNVPSIASTAKQSRLLIWGTKECRSTVTGQIQEPGQESQANARPVVLARTSHG